MKPTNTPTPECTPGYNWTPVNEDGSIVKMCLGLKKDFRDAMIHLLTGDEIQCSHGWCELHLKEEEAKLEKEWEEFKKAEDEFCGLPIQKPE